MKRAASESNVPIAQHISEHRELLAKQRDRLPALKTARERLVATRTRCTTRSTLRKRADVDVAIARLDADIERLETNEHIREFERKVVPYLEAYVKHSGAPRYKMSRFVVPGEPSTRVSGPYGSTQTQTDVVAEYLSVVQGAAPRPTIERAVDLCPCCADSEMVLVPAKAILACPKCGRSASFLDATSSAISYEENVEMVTFSYKRGNHFQDWLSNVQGLEAYEVPASIIDAVMLELYKQRVTRLDEITTQRVRAVLKVLKQRKCYDHVAQISSRITGRPPPRLPPEAVELCKLMFTAVQIPFAKFCPANRKNFLSYSYILHKMLYILGYDELCERIIMLKGQDKLKRMDDVWKLITAELDWQFFPSL